VIICPACKHSEMDGTLFCSECGSRLWGEAFTDQTSVLDTDALPRTDKIGSVVIPIFSPPTGFTLRINGATEPVKLMGKHEYLLGRSDPKHEVMPDLDLGPYGGQQLGVSRKHAYLVQTETGLSVRDLGSTNGTLVNGRVMAANQEWPLRDGDEIRLGKLAFNVYFITDASASTGSNHS
jgi:pSer/pThr/pTyr-binding forkhead associated (FHA) protein